jgi:hypothetical protein
MVCGTNQVLASQQDTGMQNSASARVMLLPDNRSADICRLHTSVEHLNTVPEGTAAQAALQCDYMTARRARELTRSLPVHAACAGNGGEQWYNPPSMSVNQTLASACTRPCLILERQNTGRFTLQSLPSWAANSLGCSARAVLYCTVL